MYNNKNAMADGPGVALVSQNSDLTYDDDLSTHGDQDEVQDRDPEYTEERFRVDRRKLEHMLQVVGDVSEQADEFFQKIMAETNTQITWPSKLKIGAKSKKDPHIKVAGKRDAVAEAKDKVLSVLDTKSNRVTLKMDVSHTDHSHVIGKGGNNIRRVMHDTGCHIHFPDSNRGSQGEKSNQVSIAGQPVGVEQARSQIRELLPLVFMFELPITGVLQPIPDTSSPTIQRIQNTYNVTVNFKQRPRVYYTTVIIRGCVNNAKAVKEATALLIEHLTGSHGATLLVNTQLEIAPQHHLFMIGRNGANIKQIMHRTGASIHFPDPTTVTPQRKGTVYINGSIESVYLARQQLIGCLPLVLMFDMKEDTEVDQGKISHLMEQLDVFISVKPKPKQPSKSVIVKSIERNAGNMYEARRQLLGLVHEPPLMVSQTNLETNSCINSTNTINGLGLGTLGLIGQNLLNINTNPLLMLNSVRSPLASPHSPSSPSPLISTTTAAGIYGPMMLLPPSSGYTLPSPYAIPPQTNGLNKDLNQNRAFVRIPTPSERTGNGSLHDGSSNGSPADSPPCTSPSDFVTKPLRGLSIAEVSIGSTSVVVGSQRSSASSSTASAEGSPVSSLPSLQPTLEFHSVKPGMDFLHMGLDAQSSQILRSCGSPSDLLEMTGTDNSMPSGITSSITSGMTTGLSSSLTSGLNSSLNSGLSSSMTSGLASGLVSALARNSSAAQQITGSALSNSGSSLKGLSATISPGKQTVLLEDNVRNIPFQNGERSSESGCESDGSDHRAPGSNRPRPRVTKPPPGFHNHPPSNPDVAFPYDYEKKKLLANKAMQNSPLTESPRMPTDLWAGLGFSKSMPDSAIRERLAKSNVRQYTGPSMSTTYEAADQEVDQDPWKDSTSSIPPLPTTSSLEVGHYSSPRRKLGDFSMENHNEVPNSVPKSSWPAKTDLAELFSKLGLSKYTDLFQQQEIDMGTFLTLTNQDLKELGISTFGARRKMLLAIADLNKGQTLRNAAPGSNNPFRDANSAGLIGSRRLDIVSQSGRW